MNTPSKDKQTDRQKFIQKYIQSNCSQLTNLSIDQGVSDTEICTNIDEMDKKPSGGRSWTRSKRISLGCLEWRSRGPTRQTGLGSCHRTNYLTRTGSHGCVAHSEEDYAYTNAEASKMQANYFGSKCRHSGAPDNLLQRLRKRSFSRDKAKRDTSRTNFNNNNNKADNTRSSSAPRSVYSYERSCTELEGNHTTTTVGNDNYSLQQMNQCNQLSVTSLLPQISLSRSVPELKSHHCCIDTSTSSVYHEIEKSLYYLKNYENTSTTYQSSFTPSEGCTKSSSNSIADPSTTAVSIKDNSSIPVVQQFCQSNCTLCSLMMNTSHYVVNTSSCETAHQGFRPVEYADTIPNTMKCSDSLVLFSKEGQPQHHHHQQQEQQQRRYDFSSNPLVSSIYSEVCSNCRYHNLCDNDTLVNSNNPTIPMSNNDTGKEYNSYRRTNCAKHSGICDSNNNLSDACSDMKTSGEKTVNMQQIANLNTSSISNCYTIPNTTDGNLSNVSNVDNPLDYQTLNTGIDDNIDLIQTQQHNSSCNSLRPDSLLSTSTTTRESSCSDLSPNSISSHDSALGGGKSQCDSVGVLKTVCPVTVTSTTKNCPKNIEHMKHVKSSDMVACLTSSVTGHIPPMCLPPSGNYCCSHTPPTPIRRPWLGDNNNTEQITSVRSRSGVQKRSVYVNASIYPIPEMLRHPDSNNGYGHNRCSRIRDRQNSYENANSINMNPTSISTVPTSNNNNNSDNVGKTTQNASNPQIPYWTHLLPYRTSTVPQNLSGRLRKSETLPNDWISTYESNKLTECEKYPLSKSTSYQLKNTLTNQNAHNSSQCSNNYYSDESKPHHSNDHDTGINGKGAKSPPPRPPIRTSSHGGISSRQTPVSQPSTSPYCQHLSCQKQQHTQGLSISSTNANNSINESPILCRYSQLYSLNSCHHNSSLSNNSPSNNTTSSNGCHSTSQHQKHPPSAHTHQYSSNEHPSAHPPHRQQFIQCPIQSHSIPSSQMNHHSKS